MATHTLNEKQIKYSNEKLIVGLHVLCFELLVDLLLLLPVHEHVLSILVELIGALFPALN